MTLRNKFLTVVTLSSFSACAPIHDSQDSNHEFVPFQTKKSAAQRTVVKPTDEPVNKGRRDIGLPGWVRGQNSFQLLLASLSKEEFQKTKQLKVNSYLALFDSNKEDFPTFLEQEVNALVEILKTNPNYYVELLGSIDDQETENSPDRSKSLIEKRVEIVKAELETWGIDPAKISIIDDQENSDPRKDRSDQRLLRSVRANLNLSGQI